MGTCLVCGQRPQRKSYIYCSIRCETIDKYNQYIKKWKLGLVDGSRGVKARGISKHIRRYLLGTFQERCVLCGWGKRNPISGQPVLEVDHINGNSEDNREENLRLVCPNCHALSSNYKNLNKGKGRSWRREKYLKG